MLKYETNGMEWNGIGLDWIGLDSDEMKEFQRSNGNQQQ
jgi:hypothetical protein